MKVSLNELEHGVSLCSTTVSREVELALSVCSACPDACVIHRLVKPRLVATARDTYLTPLISQPVNDDFLHGASLELGQDVTYGWGRAAPNGSSVGDDESTLKTRMAALLKSFAGGDRDGKAKRLFDAFLSKKSDVEVFTDAALDKAAAAHENLISFFERTVSTPGTKGADPKKIRIHQALKDADWDVNRIRPITDLGVPAFNNGSKALSTGDFDNGLGVMVNGWQYVFVQAERYEYVSCKKQYEIDLKFVFYDVFGLDDDDLIEFGAASTWGTTAQQGITAWWQLQHQFNHAPLLTRALVRKTFVASTKDG